MRKLPPEMLDWAQYQHSANHGRNKFRKGRIIPIRCKGAQDNRIVGLENDRVKMLSNYN